MQCPKCSFQTESEIGFKAHMSKSHGGYDLETLKGVGIKPSRGDIARNLAGNTSAAEVTSQAPDKEPSVGDSGPTTRRTRKSKEVADPAVEAAKEQIVRLRCQRIASLPYTLLAKIVGDEAVKLDEQEEIMLTESYVTLAKAYGWEGTSKLLLWGDVLICQAAIVMDPERKAAIMRAVENFGMAQEVTEQVESQQEPVTE
jgi:hypothetical protein